MGKELAAPEAGTAAAGSTSAKFGAAEVVVVDGEPLGEQGRERTVGKVAAVVAGQVAANTALGLMSGVLRAAAAGAAVDRHSRRMRDRRVVEMILLGWSSGRCVMARIEKKVASSGAMTGGVAEASGTQVEAAEFREAVAVDIAVVVDLGAGEGTAGQEFECRVHLVHVGCIETSCSCPGMAQGRVLVQDVLVDMQGSHPATEEVDRSYRIEVRCRSSNFPCHHPEDS